MRNISFKNLEEVFECYGRGSLIPIDNIKQILFYVVKGCQPKFIYEHETKPGKITCWFLKSETNYVYKMWMNNRPDKDD